MLTSLLEFIPRPTLRDTGLPQQWQIFSRLRERTGRTPPVLDARDVLGNPRGILGRCCELLGVEFCEAMLTWPPGRRDTDGIWAKHWYAKVEQTTSFGSYQPKHEPVPESLLPLLADCERIYAELFPFRIRA